MQQATNDLFMCFHLSAYPIELTVLISTVPKDIEMRLPSLQGKPSTPWLDETRFGGMDELQ